MRKTHRIYTIYKSYKNILRIFFLFSFVAFFLCVISFSTQAADAVNTAPAVAVLPPPESIPVQNNNLSYLNSEVGQIRVQLEGLHKGSAKNVGYDGGFFIKSDDDKFRLNVNGRLQPRYSFNIARHAPDGQTIILRRAFLYFSGNAYNEKATFLCKLATTTAPMLEDFDVGYDFSSYFGVHMVRTSMSFSAEVNDDSGQYMFVSPSLLGARYDLGEGVGVTVIGGVRWFSYYVGVFNGLNLGLASNSNNEMAYSVRFDFKILNELSPGESDVDYSDKPALAAGVAGAFGNYEKDTQARLLAGTGDVRFKYKGLSTHVSGILRQIDPDQFTRAQIDLGLAAYVGYFVIPKKLEFGLRASALLDDINSVGVNIAMDSDLDTGLKDDLAGGDVGGDSDNEYEYSAGVNYYFNDYNLKLQAQYTYMIDGITGASDRISHIGMIQAQVAF